MDKVEQRARELLGTVRPPIKVHRDSYTDFLWLYPAPYEYPPDGMYLYRADDVERLLAAALREQPEARGVVGGYDPNELLRAAMALIRRGHSVANDPGDAVLVERIADHLHSLTTAQQPVQGGRNRLLAYADSYRTMAKMGDGRVDCLSVAVDIERNMAPHAQAAPPSAPVGVDRLDLMAADVQAMMDAAKCVAHAPRDMPTRRMEAAYLAVLDRIAGRRLAWESQREPGRWVIYSPDGSGYQINDDESGEAAKWLRRVAESLGGDALTQQPAQAAPGWKMVPVKATEAMQEAFNDWRPTEGNKYAGAQSVSAQDRWEFLQRYAAMLDATPPGDDAAGVDRLWQWSKK